MNARVSTHPYILIQGGGQKPPDSFLSDEEPAFDHWSDRLEFQWMEAANGYQH